MQTTELAKGEIRTLIVLLAMVSLAAAFTIASCGGGGGSNGGLCDQCGGDPDGPCQESVVINAPPAPAFCPEPADPNDPFVPCPVDLACRRRLGTGQRVCYPADPSNPSPNSEDVTLDLFFECDDARPNPVVRSPGPSVTMTPRATETAAPTETATATGLTATPTPTASASSTCGNDTLDDGEECDGSDLGGETCDSLCLDGPGTGELPSCNLDCTLNFANCTAASFTDCAP
jgi:hypothetical protein